MVDPTEQLECPLCGSRSSHRLFSNPPWSIQVCERCENGWTVPAPGSVDYERADFHQEIIGIDDSQKAEPEIETLPPAWRDSVRSQVELLARHVRAGAEILEVGCGRGLLLKQLRAKGFKVTGVEPSAKAAAVARGAGLTVFEGYFPNEELRASRRKFDAVIMSHVLEHIGKPMEALQEAASVAPGGKLLLVQTNWQGIIPGARKGKWYAWVPNEHFWHFTPQGLAAITGALSFREVEREYSDLVHTRRTSRLLLHVAHLRPQWRDQFHLLLQMPNISAASKGS